MNTPYFVYNPEQRAWLTPDQTWTLKQDRAQGFPTYPLANTVRESLEREGAPPLRVTETRYRWSPTCA